MANQGHGAHHIVPIRTYLKILVILLVLTVATVVFAPPVSGIELGAFSALVAFAIATAKATLVLAIFMGLKYDNKLNLAIFLTGIFFVMILWLFSVVDIYSRINVPSTL